MASLQQPVPVQSGTPYSNAEAKRAAEIKRVHRQRKIQALQLQRENILSQRTSNPARRAALESALAEIEAQLTELG